MLDGTPLHLQEVERQVGAGGDLQVAGPRDAVREHLQRAHLQARHLGDAQSRMGLPVVGQFSDYSAPFDASELRVYVEDMPVTLSSRRGGRMI
ncbi:MAG: hypothetical protein ACRDPY_30205 [Streptosporangiaceae bacterium]